MLTKSGCNSGSCHGASIGRGGFRLSLLGYDPQADYDSLINEFEGRRVNRAHADKSLLLRKPSLDVDHEGGLRLEPGSDGYETLLRWIAAGSPRGPSRKLERLEVTPTAKWLPQPGEKLAVRVIAHFRTVNPDDAGAAPPQSATGDQSPSVAPDALSVEDGTRWAVFTPLDSAAVEVTPGGEITVLRRGQNSVMVRFLGEVAAVTVTVPVGDRAVVPGGRPRANFIDDRINESLDQLRLPHSPRADDVTFVRRVYLDLIGALPNPDEVDSFLADDSPDRRARLVERLLGRPEFVDLWSHKWGDLLRIESRRLQPQGAAAFHAFVRQSVAQNTPFDTMARDMLLSLGNAYEAGAANFSRVPADARQHAEYVSEVFLGVRLRCANCHNHPLDRWTQDDYHGLAAVFARLNRDGGPEVRLQSRGEVTHPKSGQPAIPRIPGAANLSARDPRNEFTRWLVARDNPFFARAAVNRVWRELMGRGLVEPVDDHRATNPPTHPALLDELAGDLVAHEFDVRHTIRTIVASETYQRSSLSVPGNEGDERFYSKWLVRPLPPHVLVDAVAKVTGVPERLGDLPPGTTAVSLGDSRVASEPLDLLGRCSREAGCTPQPAATGSLPLALHTINGPWLNAKLTHPAGRVSRLLAAGATDEDFVVQLCRLALARSPSKEELAHWRAEFRADEPGDRAAVAQDFLWALLNSVEFSCNH